MVKVAAIVYSVLCLQLCLGVAMLATASVASNRQMNAGSRAIDALLRVIGRGSVAVGLWGFVCVLGAPFYLGATPQFDIWRLIGFTAGLIYAVLIVSGGWLQSRVATSLLFPPPIEEQRRLEYR